MSLAGRRGRSWTRVIAALLPYPAATGRLLSLSRRPELPTSPTTTNDYPEGGQHTAGDYPASANPAPALTGFFDLIERPCRR